MDKRKIILYADEFPTHVWEEYCTICGVSTMSKSITIRFNMEDVEENLEED